MAVARLVLCADDFAISRGTSEAIAQLVRNRSINAVSCMTASSGWSSDADLLLDACATNPEVEIGLHLTLSDKRPLGLFSCLNEMGRLPGPDQLLRLCVARRAKPSEFTAEIERQFSAFRAKMGRAPDFVDAHQHVHVYPVLRHLVAKAAAKHAPHAWVRVPSDRLGSLISRPFRAKAIGSALHSAGFKRLLRRYRLRFNDTFAGHYDFKGNYSSLLPLFFSRASGFHVVMCHPGSDDVPDDTIGTARIEEAKVLGQLPLSLRLEPERQSIRA